MRRLIFQGILAICIACASYSLFWCIQEAQKLPQRPRAHYDVFGTIQVTRPPKDTPIIVIPCHAKTDPLAIATLHLGTIIEYGCDGRDSVMLPKH